MMIVRQQTRSGLLVTGSGLLVTGSSLLVTGSSLLVCAGMLSAGEPEIASKGGDATYLDDGVFVSVSWRRDASGNAVNFSYTAGDESFSCNSDTPGDLVTDSYITSQRGYASFTTAGFDCGPEPVVVAVNVNCEAEELPDDRLLAAEPAIPGEEQLTQITDANCSILVDGKRYESEAGQLFIKRSG